MPPEKDGRLESAKGLTNISGTIWSMCFISGQNNQPGKERKPLLAILLNRLLSTIAQRMIATLLLYIKPHVQRS